MGTRKPRTGIRKVRILLVDDHPMIREGLASIIGHETDLEICAEAGDAAEALALALALKPDMAIVDLSLGTSSGISLINSLSERLPGVLVLVLSMHDEAVYAERALRAGAVGYVMKKEPPGTVVAAIRRVLEGKVYASEEFTSALLQHLVRGGRKGASLGPQVLSDREFELFHMIGQGMTTRQIAEALHLSPTTVATHRENIKKKLRLKSTGELTRRALLWSRSDSVP